MISLSLIFSGAGWFWPTAGAFVVAFALLAWGYRIVPSGFLRWVCPVLKIAGLAALAFCLLEPLGSGQRARAGANEFLIVADNSQGLQIKDRGATRTRGESLLQLLDPQHGGWQSALEENFDVRRYSFDSRLQNSRDLSELKFDGRASAIGSTLRTLAERYHGQPVAGILLFTDGNATDIHGELNLEGLPPIYPVILGSQDPPRDIALGQLHTTQTDFEDAPVSIQADVNAYGFARQSIVAQVVDESGRQVASQTLSARTDKDLLAFRFQFRPEKQGLLFYRVQVRARAEARASAPPELSEEATLANNDAVAVVDRGRGPFRILYVSGRPNWEFKFLNRALQDDEQLQLVGLVRVAKREPKFNFLGRTGETSNPLYRGFGNQSAEDVERYDQPVLVPINPRDEFELRGGFPHTAEELYGYQAVILGDLEAEFFTPEQAALVQKFVSERGGGLLMLGGMESFQQGNYQHTPIGDMLPVYLDRIEETNPPGPLSLNLTREGWLQSWARLRDNESDEKARLQGMVSFQVLNRIREVKPGASVIATVTDTNGQPYPALVVQRFGRGHTAALTLGDMWRWGFHDADAHHDMDKAWRQLTRWLVNDVPRPIELTVEPKPNDPNGAVQFQVRVRDAKFDPVDSASVSVEVQPVLAEATGGTRTNALRITAEPSLTEPGLYEGSYVPQLTGGYRATAYVTNSAGAELGRAAAGWTSDLAAEEFRSLTPNVALLETIARRTGGEIVAADKLGSFAKALPHRQAPIMESWTYPLWHTPAVFALALSCFLAEWGLRRWKGMA